MLMLRNRNPLQHRLSAAFTTHSALLIKKKHDATVPFGILGSVTVPHS